MTAWRYYGTGSVTGAAIREELRTWPPNVARSVGGLEAQLNQIRAELRERSAPLSNATRTNAMLDLMVMGRQGRGDTQKYPRVIREHLIDRGGTAAPQKPGVTGGPRLQNA